MKRDRLVVTGIHQPYADNAPSLGDRPPVALGMVMAYARKMLGSDPAFDLEPRFARSIADAERIVSGPGRHVLLFSDYVWNYENNMELSRRIKESRPDVLTIHGGANIPGFAKPCEKFLRDHPHVDFVVKGEGETALADLLAAIASSDAKASEVASTSTIRDGKFIQTPVRARTKNLEEFPSPYLSGMFDGLAPEHWASATIETNRGCPYGCTFCDWGAATLQKIQTFSLERIREEVRWLAKHRVPALWIADANFGIFPRDVEVARIIVDTKKELGFPRRLTVQYAKNTHQHLIDIIALFLDAEMISTGIVSIQTRDDRTLGIVRRKNIKTREYDKLRAEFQRRNLPLAVQLMIGLPGATLQTIEDDLSYYFDTSMEVQLFRTVMLPNSPMADPDYQETHELQARHDGLLVSTATMSEHDFHIATLVGRAYHACHHYGLIRYPLVWLKREHGLDPLAVLHALAVDEPMLREKFPLLACIPAINGYAFDLTASHDPHMERFRAENLWGKLNDELFAWLSAKYGIARDSSWDAIAAAQDAIMPTSARTYPCTIELPHDVVRWYADGREGKERPLASYGPATLVVEDPLGFAHRAYANRRATRLQWELASPLARARAGTLGRTVSDDVPLVHPDVALSWSAVSPAAPE